MPISDSCVPKEEAELRDILHYRYLPLLEMPCKLHCPEEQVRMPRARSWKDCTQDNERVGCQ